MVLEIHTCRHTNTQNNYRKICHMDITCIYLIAQFHTHFLRDSGSNTHSGNTTRLSTANLFIILAVALIIR